MVMLRVVRSSNEPGENPGLSRNCERQSAVSQILQDGIPERFRVKNAGFAAGFLRQAGFFCGNVYGRAR